MKHRATFPDFKVDEKKPAKSNDRVIAMVKKDGSCVILHNIGTEAAPDIRAFSRSKNEIICLRGLCQILTKEMPLTELRSPAFYAAGELELFQNGAWSHQLKSQLGALLNADDFGGFFSRKGLNSVTAKLSFFDLGKENQVFGKTCGSDPFDRLKNRLERLAGHKDRLVACNTALAGTPFSLDNCAWKECSMEELANMEINHLATEFKGRIPFMGENGEGIVYCPIDGNNRNKLKGEITVDAKVVCPVEAKSPKGTNSPGWLVEETKSGTLFCVYGGVGPANHLGMVGSQVELKLLNVKSIDYDNKEALVKSLQGGNPTFLMERRDKAPYITKSSQQEIDAFAAAQGITICDMPNRTPNRDSGPDLMP